MRTGSVNPSGEWHQQQQQQKPRRLIMMNRDQLISAIIFVTSSLLLVIVVAPADCKIHRTQYHEQGVHGPHSYKFGFTSGDHKNPQERHEVSDKKGHVKGWYSYKDPHGKMMVFHYEAHPKKGFKVHKYKKHHKHHHHAAAASSDSPVATNRDGSSAKQYAVAAKTELPPLRPAAEILQREYQEILRQQQQTKKPALVRQQESQDAIKLMMNIPPSKLRAASSSASLASITASGAIAGAA